MKMLFVARNIPLPGHRENDIVLQLAKQLERKGSQVSVLFPAEWLPIPSRFLSGIHHAISQLGGRFSIDGIGINVLMYIRLPTLSLSYLLSGFFWTKKKQEPVDFVHAHYVMPDGWIGRKLAKSNGCPLAVTVRQGDLHKMARMSKYAPVKLMYLHILSKADLVFSPSHSVVHELKALGYSAEFLPHGVEGTPILEAKVSERDTITVLVAASLIESKRVDWVVRALGNYTGKNKVKLVVLGDGECRVELTELARKLSVSADFLGHVCREDVFEKMLEADIFALPSAQETFGLVYLEAALRKCAVIATKGTGVDGCFEDGLEMAFSLSNFDSFCETLVHLIDNNEERFQMAKNARLRAQKDYLWDAVIDKYMAIMARMV